MSATPQLATELLHYGKGCKGPGAIPRASYAALTNSQYCWQFARLMINDFAVARALHVLALVHWIGGVAMVTTIVLPRARALANAHAALAAFEAFEGPFAAQARFSILLAGLSGFYMLNKLQAWTLLLDPAFWWLASDGRGVGGVHTDRVRV